MKEHLTCLSDFDRLPLDVIIMAPSHPIGIVQISHGMCEHKERYIPFMQFLNSHGYVCIIHDHRGHGKSILHQDDLGYFYEDGHIGIVEDVHQLSTLIKLRYPHLPLYLFGHSMGSLVVRCYLKKYDHDIDGLFVCGSPSYNPLASFGIYLTSKIGKQKGQHYRSSFIQKVGFDSFNRHFDKSTPNSWICSDVNVVKNYNQNPLCAFTFTTNGFHALFHLMKETYHLENWQMKNKNLPIHFIAGQDDPCIQNEKKFNEAVQCLKTCGYTQVSSHLFKGMRHEILNEVNKESVYQHILEKLKSW